MGAISYLFVRVRRAPLWELIFPILGIAVLAYTLYKNVQGVAFPYSRFPLVVGIWLIVGLGIILASPGLARRIGASLARDEELGPRSGSLTRRPSQLRSRVRRPEFGAWSARAAADP